MFVRFSSVEVRDRAYKLLAMMGKKVIHLTNKTCFVAK